MTNQNEMEIERWRTNMERKGPHKGRMKKRGKKKKDRSKRHACHRS